MGRMGKVMDLRNNGDVSRIQNPTDADLARLERSRRALELLGDLK